jgi:hypothetical protein
MASRILLTVVAVAMLGVSGTASYLAARPRPVDLTLEPSDTIDLGSVAPEAVVEGHFVLRNESNKQVEIARVISSCGCTVARLVDTQLEPGESTELHASLTAAKRPGRQAVALVLVYRLRYGNEARMGQRKLTLEATVEESEVAASASEQ